MVTQTEIPAGTVVKIGGMPFRLTEAASAESAEGNYRLAFSQDEQRSSNPVHAAGSPTTQTNILSLLPMCDMSKSRI